MAKVYRCKGRTSSGRIMKGYKLTKGGVVKAGGGGRKRSTRRSSKPAAVATVSPIGAAEKILAGGRKPRAKSKRTRAPRRRSRASSSSSAPRKLSAFRQIAATKHGEGVILVNSTGTAYAPADAAIAGRTRLRPARQAGSLVAFVGSGRKPRAASRRRKAG